MAGGGVVGTLLYTDEQEGLWCEGIGKALKWPHLIFRTTLSESIWAYPWVAEFPSWTVHLFVWAWPTSKFKYFQERWHTWSGRAQYR